MISKKKKPVNYVDNKKFLEEIKQYKKQCKVAEAEGREKPRLSEYIGKCIWQISEGLAQKPRFMNYSYIDEMKSDALENCFMYFDNFNSDKYDNPFAYFTQVTKWAFMRRIIKEEKNRYLIYKSFQETLSGIDHELMVDYNDNVISTPQMYDNINEFIKNYEERERVKKEAKKQAKKGLEKFVEEDENEDK